MQLTLQQIFWRFARPLRFGVVGVSGIVVNSAIRAGHRARAPDHF